MSISSALNNAASGLAGSGRLAETISNNVANALTPGYRRQVTELSSLTLGGHGSGVRVTGTARVEDPFLTAQRRAMDAALGASAARSDAYTRILAAFGEPGASGSLSSLATRLETTLMSATASPQSAAKLTDAVVAAGDVASAINRIAAENVRMRTEADGEINRQVGQVNTSLHAIDRINKKIVTLETQGVDTNALRDERDRLIDGISSIIPVRSVNRENGQIALYTAGGGLLLDGKVFELGFQPAPNVVTPQMSLGAGLHGLTQDQGAIGGPVAIDMGAGAGLMDGGSLAALFEVRDRIAPEFDAEMDRYAADLIDRFRSLMPPAALDPAGNGIFVDSAPGATTGLAGRIALNAAVDPSQGGEAWRLRAGLDAAAPGPEGFGTYLQGLADAMVTARAPAGFVSQTAAASGATIASEIASFFGGRAARSDEDRAYLVARQTFLVESETHATGVDSDSELQSLMLVEQAYAANSRVLSVIDQLMKLLLEA